MNQFFTSDEHYGHLNVIKFCSRPFKSIDEMTEGLITNHNAIVKPGDKTWHLGDFSMNKRWVKDVLPRLNGTHVLVMGNHDQCHRVNFKPTQLEAQANALKFYHEAGFEEVMEYAKLTIDELTLHMHHMPYTEDHTKDQRYREYRLKPNKLPGHWLLHGHIHQLRRIGERQLNVGVDVNNYRPISLDEIVQDIRKVSDN